MILLAPMEACSTVCCARCSPASAGWTAASAVHPATDQLMPKRSLATHRAPKLLNGGAPAGVPVHLAAARLRDVQCMVEKRGAASPSSSRGDSTSISPAARPECKCVSRHRGGAVLLDEPELIHAIVIAVRRAAPALVMVSARCGSATRTTAARSTAPCAIHAAGARRDRRPRPHQGGRLQVPAYWGAHRRRDAVPCPSLPTARSDGRTRCLGAASAQLRAPDARSGYWWQPRPTRQWPAAWFALVRGAAAAGGLPHLVRALWSPLSTRPPHQTMVATCAATTPRAHRSYDDGAPTGADALTAHPAVHLSTNGARTIRRRPIPPLPPP